MRATDLFSSEFRQASVIIPKQMSHFSETAAAYRPRCQLVVGEVARAVTRL